MYKIIGADGNQYGPVTLEELKNWVRAQRANGETLVQGPGMNDWRPLRTFTEVSEVPGLTAPLQPAVYPMGTAAVLTPEQAANMVKGPSISLLVLGILTALLYVLSTVGNLMGATFTMPHSTGDPQVDKIVAMMSGSLGVVQGLIGLVFAGLTIFAALQLGKLRSYGFVMTMLILNMLPCCTSCCCLIGLPIGIWGLVILFKPEVKAAFH